MHARTGILSPRTRAGFVRLSMTPRTLVPRQRRRQTFAGEPNAVRPWGSIMPVHPQAQRFLDQMEGAPPPYEMKLADARAMMEGFNALAGKPEPVARVEDREIPGPAGPLRIRAYAPTLELGLPVVVYYHAGGYV